MERISILTTDNKICKNSTEKSDTKNDGTCQRIFGGNKLWLNMNDKWEKSYQSDPGLDDGS